MEDTERKIAIICSKGGLDEVYPALILANAARQSGIEAMIFGRPDAQRRAISRSSMIRRP
jgi:peroxiredoxin family protein